MSEAQVSRTQVVVSQEEAFKVLEQVGAFRNGHFVLSSGLHSPHYFQVATVFEHPAVAGQVSQALAPACAELKPQVVLAPAMGAVLFGYELARALGVRSVFAERPTGEFELRRGFSLSSGERVLLAENVVTTGGSVLETAELVRKLGAQVVGYAVVVDRSGGRFNPSEPVLAYAAAQAETFPADACPLCAQGMPVEKPGSRKA